MAGLSASGLKTQIRSYTETDSTVLSDSVLENIILNAQYRIFRDVPIDADRKQQLGNLVAGQESINAPAGCLFIRGPIMLCLVEAQESLIQHQAV
jgi:hypothetical protein